MVFDIEKDIVEVIVRGMMFDPADFDGSDVDSDAEDNDPALFGSDAERDAVLSRRRQQAELAIKRALSLFECVGEEEEDEDGNPRYSYLVTIPQSKTPVFQLSVR
jgi:hypothetical protein